MSFFEQARQLDVQDRPVEAAEAYERAIGESNEGSEPYLNVAVIYLQCADPGYAAFHHLSPAVTAHAERRFFELLEQAHKRFPNDGEARFWRLYYDFVHLGGNDFTDEALAIARDTNTLVPFFYLFTRPGGERYRDQALNLYRMVNRGGTTRDRYIASVLHDRFRPGEIGTA